jgi:hypothetical protein
MTKAKHTPGPLRIEVDAGGVRVVTAEGLNVALCVAAPNRSINSAVANGLLFAEAPAMAEELREALDLLRAVIDQKALGDVPHIADGGASLRLECHDRIASARAILARLDGESKPVIHLAARETFAVDGIPACKGGGGFNATHTLTEVTCGNCRRTAEFARAERLGLKDNDETWANARLDGEGES